MATHNYNLRTRNKSHSKHTQSTQQSQFELDAENTDSKTNDAQIDDIKDDTKSQVCVLYALY